LIIPVRGILCAVSANLLRAVATLVGGGFIVYAAVAIVRGTFYDSDDGPLDRATQPLAFWLSVVSMTLLGLFILGVGHRWASVRMIFVSSPAATAQH
jgi:hypothetical protein